MNYLKNQRGHALAIVLIIIVLFSVLGLGLVTLNASASKQFNNKEQTVQARHFAEMGLVHYKSEIINALSAHNLVLDGLKKNDSLTKRQKINAINVENDKLCNKLTGLSIVNLVNTNDPNYDISIIKCQPNSEKTKIDITVNGEGTSLQGKVVNIDLNLSVKLPGILTPGTVNDGSDGTSGNGNPSPTTPTPPTGRAISNGWPCTDKNCGSHTISNYTDVSTMGDLSVKKADLLFNDSLVMESLEVEPGNGLNLTVKKDLFLKGKLDVHNHACIAVGGNFTAIKSIDSINKFYLYVYGDAYLPSTIDFTSTNNMIYVNGDIYIDGEKQDKPKPYNSIPQSFSGCGDHLAPMPSIPETPGGNSSIPQNLDIELITIDYRY